MSIAALVRSYPVLVFDLDGTLIDSAADIGRTLSLALQDCGLEPLDGERSPDLHSPFGEIVGGLLRARGLPSTLAERVMLAYRERLAVSAYPQSEPYPGVMPFLAERLRQGVRMAICTNKRQPEAVRMLGHFGLLDHFGAIVGADSTHAAKPHPAPLQMALAALGARPEQALMIGDTHVDALCARHGGVAFLWHRAGYGGARLMAGEMAASFDSFDEFGVDACGELSVGRIA